MSESAATTPAAPARRRSIVRTVQPWASQIGITAAFILLWITFILIASSTFLDTRIYQSFAQTVPYFALIALPLTMVIISGDIDLSFPSIMALGMVGFVYAWEATGSMELGILAALATGGAAGLFNGVVVTMIGIPSLVVTIGTQFLFRGLTLVLVGGRTLPLVETRGTPLWEVLVGRPLGVPMQFWWLVLAAVGTWLLLNRHRLGQNAYAVGANRQAAQLMGIPIRRTRVILFTLTGVMAAFAGTMVSLSIVNFYPNMGAGFLLPTLAAVFVGGTSVFGGRGSVWGTFLGAFMIGGIQAGIIAAGLTNYYENLIYGSVILISVSIHAVLQRRFER